MFRQDYELLVAEAWRNESEMSATNLMKISTIVCTHNPRADYLARVLDALRKQSLAFSEWELLLIDNASSEVLANNFDLSWHPASRHVREDELGLAPARLRGIAEAKADVIVFVDDDNLLATKYLEMALEISENFKWLGAWGAGKIAGEFERPPADWQQKYLTFMAVRESTGSLWSNRVFDFDATPFGAGLCVRRSVAESYASQLRKDADRRSLGRIGVGLGGGEDIDLAYTSKVFGLGWGVFKSLDLVHLIPAERVSQEYILRLIEAASASHVVLQSKYSNVAPQPAGLKRQIVEGGWKLVTCGLREYLVNRAQKRGYNSGCHYLRNSAAGR